MKFKKIKALLVSATVAASAIAGTIYASAETNSTFNYNTPVYEEGTASITINGRSYKGLTDRDILNEVLPSGYQSGNKIKYSAFIDGLFIYYVVNGAKYTPAAGSSDYMSGIPMELLLRSDADGGNLTMIYDFTTTGKKYFVKSGPVETLNISNGNIYFSTYGELYYNERNITPFTDKIENPEWYNSKEVEGMDGKGNLYIEFRASLSNLAGNVFSPEIVRTSIVYNTHEPKYYIFDSIYQGDAKNALVDQTLPEDYDESASLEDEASDADADEDADIEGPEAEDVLDSEDEPEPEIEDEDFEDAMPEAEDEDFDEDEDLDEDFDEDLDEDFDEDFDEDETNEDEGFEDEATFDEADDTAELEATETDDTNPGTGVALGMIPALMAASAAIASRKRK